MSYSHLKSEAYINEERQYFAPTGRIQYADIGFVKGNGATLTDMDGNTYIDLFASASVANVGHCHPKVVNAIKKQAEQLVHNTPAYFTHNLVLELQKRLTNITPGQFPKKVIFGNSGSDANDGMIKYARAYTGRQNIITFTDAYHGSTFGAITESAVSLNMRRNMGPFVPGIYQLPFPDENEKLPQEDEIAFSERYLDHFRLAFRTYLPPEEVAAILIEPIQGDGGIRQLPFYFVKELYALCQEHGILFMVDEVNQGLARSGKMWSIDHFDIAPDLLATGKSLAAGLPLSAIVGRAEIMNSLPAPGHCFTTAGNPICCAASLATLDIIEEEELMEKSACDGEYVKAKLQTMQEAYPFIKRVRMYGLNGGIELVVEENNQSANTDCANKVMTYLLNHGVIMITLAGNILRFQPPLVITREELDRALSLLEAAFKAYRNGEIVLDTNQPIGW
ncbi:MAG: aspartate aminotransferase family protein [Aerococcus suis]|nr:aspartate aminotransferase family protein [Aerococcus suis]